MNVREIMASVVQKVKPEDSLYKAATIMKEYDIGCVLVADNDRLQGVITDEVANLVIAQLLFLANDEAKPQEQDGHAGDE